MLCLVSALCQVWMCQCVKREEVVVDQGGSRGVSTWGVCTWGVPKTGREAEVVNPTLSEKANSIKYVCYPVGLGSL
jgi:hypothetical protein